MKSQFEFLRVVLQSAISALLLFTTGFPADAESVVKQLNDQLAAVAERLSASVVVISVDKPNWAGAEGGGEGPPEPFREYGGSRRGGPRPRFAEGQGSGFVLRKDGYILTNNHVVEGASKVTVRLQDGRVFPATVQGVDDKTDLAVLKVAATNLPVARLGNSDAVRVGEFAIAIGTPYSLDYSVTVGVVSQKHRSGLGMASYEDFIQTDAKINPGNSGGPLVNIDGEVIGVNTLIRGLRTDIGFAIPINMAKEIADKLIADGKVVRPWIGVGFKLLSSDRELQQYLGGTGNEVVVDVLHPNAPATGSALRPADIIVAVNGRPIRSPKEVQIEVMKKKVGEEVVFDIVREGKPVKIMVKTSELPTEPAPPPPALPAESRLREKPEKGIGLTVQPLNKVPVEQLELKEAHGVFVSGADIGGLGEQAGLQHGDVITEINRQPIETVEQYNEALKKADLTKGLLIFFNRQGTLSYALVQRAGGS